MEGNHSFFTMQLLLFVGIIGIGYGAVKLMLNKSEIKHAHAQFAEDIRLTDAVIKDLCSEHNLFEEELASYDAYAEEIHRELTLV